MSTTTLIRGGLLVDGTGAPPAPADVVVTGDRIAAVVPPRIVPPRPGWAVLDITGQALAPGFIDAHSHADGSPLLPVDDTSKVLQGVTTEVVGNCGLSLAPLAGSGDARSFRTEALLPGRSPGWASLTELFAEVDAAGSVTNTCHLLGHGTLRAAVIGEADRPPNTDELRRMCRILEEACASGVFGLSSGLVYPPGMYATPAELAVLCSVLGEHQVYATHVRNESDGLVAALHEVLDTTAGAACRVHVSHLKVTGRRNWGRIASALAVLDEARDRGIPVTQDAYPYAAASTALSACVPPWAHDGGDGALLARLDDDRTLARLRTEVESDVPADWENVVASAGWDGVVVAGTASGRYEGLSLPEVARSMGTDCFDALVALLREERLRVSMVEFSMHEDDVERVLQHPRTMIGSDGLPAGQGGRPHPRLHGTFPRVLARYVRERGLLPLGEAVHRMTALTADTFGVPERGTVAPGLVADLVAFDPGTVVDRATYHDPLVAPAGIAWVMQAGELVVREGRWLGRRRGRRLTPRDRSSLLSPPATPSSRGLPRKEVTR